MSNEVHPMVLAAAKALCAHEDAVDPDFYWQHFSHKFIAKASAALGACGALDCLEALEHIGEYWNRDQNEIAMADACWHAVNTAHDVVSKVYGSKSK